MNLATVVVLCTLPPASESERVSLSEHIPCLAHRTFPHSLTTHTHTPFPISPHPRDAALHRAPRGPRPRPPVGRVGRACSCAHLSPLRPPATAVSATSSTARPNRPSKTPRAAASGSVVRSSEWVPEFVSSGIQSSQLGLAYGFSMYGISMPFTNSNTDFAEVLCF